MPTSLRSSGFRESHAPRRVLIVDHHTESAAELRLRLESKAHTVRTASSARAAVAVVSTFAPDVALVVVDLPDGNGRDLVGVLREQPGLERCRFIAGTGSLPAAFVAHLAQPQNFEELLALIDEREDRKSVAG